MKNEQSVDSFIYIYIYIYIYIVFEGGAVLSGSVVNLIVCDIFPISYKQLLTIIINGCSDISKKKKKKSMGVVELHCRQ
jgi:hypothetical protein